MSHGKGQDIVCRFEIALQCHRQTSNRARLAHKTRRVKISKSSRVQIFMVSYFAVLILAFWSWVTRIAKIWTSRKFPAIRYVCMYVCVHAYGTHLQCIPIQPHSQTCPGFNHFSFTHNVNNHNNREGEGRNKAIQITLSCLHTSLPPHPTCTPHTQETWGDCQYLLRRS